MPSFDSKKALRFVITLGTGTFDSTTNNQVVIEGFRSIANIQKAGGIQMTEMRAQIYGLSQHVMNEVSTFNWKVGLYYPNTIEVYAIDGAAETLVFAGNMVNAWADYNSMPNVFLHIQARVGHVAALAPVSPRSYNGAIDVATVAAELATAIGVSFENNGVQTQLSDLYLANTALEQLRELVKAAGIDYYLDDKTLAICPKNVPRGGLIPEISPATGLIGYPTFDGFGLNFRILFNPGVVWGGKIKVVSGAINASGQWFVASISHDLEAEKPDGQWFSTIRALPNEFSIAR